jgi:multiple sugar transport system ATP-binding protein
MARVVLENIYKTYGAAGKSATGSASSTASSTSSETAAPTVLRSINLDIQDGEFLVLVGPSGCGKSTLLRLIAGLEEITAGQIQVGDRRVNDLPPKARDIAMVFQNYALYPHMSVYDNLAFGLRRAQGSGLTQSAQGALGEKLVEIPAGSTLPNWLENLLVSSTRKLPIRYSSPRETAIARRVKTVAQMLQIDHLLDRLPKQLSGGQKQRVALGRAMARNPQVFLMDEPLSNLDAKLRAETRSQIVKLQRELGTTTLYVTHDQTEAMTMGDRIAVMNGGVIQQLATPLELYNQPANRFVAEFIGSPPMNFLPVRVQQEGNRPVLVHRLFRLPLASTDLTAYQGREVTLGFRPEHVHLAPPSPNALPVQVDLVEALGSETYLQLSLRSGDLSEGEKTLLQVRTEPDRQVRVGDGLNLAIAPEKLHLFDPDSGDAIR